MKNSNDKCNEEKRVINGLEFSAEEWESFTEKNEFWLAISNEINERESLLLSYLRSGEMKKEWTDDEIRARINELDYLKTIPKFFIMDLTLSKEKANQKEP